MCNEGTPLEVSLTGERGAVRKFSGFRNSKSELKSGGA